MPTVRVGSFELKNLVGEGAFGCVYEARHTRLGYRVAVKQSKWKDGDEAKLFEQEAQLLARIPHHFTIPALHDYVVDAEGFPFMVLTWAPGRTLERLIDVQPSEDRRSFVARRPLDDEHTLWVADRLLEALAHLHTCGVFHGDVKPANLIVDVPRHGAILTDFTVAVSDPTRDSVGKGGSPGYTAPEILSRMPPIAESDLWAVGKVMIAMVGGDPCAGTVPSDVRPSLRGLIDALVCADPTVRPGSANLVRRTILDLREREFGRTSTREVLRFRDGTVPEVRGKKP